MRNIVLLAILLTLIIAGIAHRLTLPQTQNTPKPTPASPTPQKENRNEATASPTFTNQPSPQSSPSSTRIP